METTDNLNLPYLMPSQAQKHVTHNEALRALDILVQLSVVSRGQQTPPVGPQAGARYIVPQGAGGEWTGRADNVAAWQDGAWTFHIPRNGWLAHVEDEAALFSFDDGVWKEPKFSMGPTGQLGVNTSADTTNRLAVAGTASLFTHVGEGHQIKINKATAADTASVLFQTDWSGRAEFGLAGDDDFHVKVSPDGSSFTEAIVVNRTTGQVTFPAGVTGLREQLTGDRTYFVGTTGSDTNSGLSAGEPFATLQKAVDEAHKLDCSIYHVTIRLADGSYGGANIARPLFGGGTLFIVGNEAMPANVILTSGTTVGGTARVSISGVRFAITVDYHHALSAGDGARLLIGKVDFGPASLQGHHINGTGYGEIIFGEDYTISGGACRHLNLSGPIYAGGSDRTITLVGTPAMEWEFLSVSDSAVATFWNLAISGSATGKRYSATTTGVINLYGKPTNFLPGNLAGTVATGGVYS